MKRYFILIIALLLIFSACPAQAKWWIFGAASEDGVSLEYLNFNNMAYQDTNGSATFFTDALPEGDIVVRGKARTGSGDIATVRVTLNNQETWQKAKFSDDGAFEYRFTPEENLEYHFFVEITDTSGTINELADTELVFSVVQGSSAQEAEKALAELFRNYQAEDLRGFNTLVSQNFVAGSDILESAVRGDFLALDFINVRYWINSVSQAGNGDAIITFRFDRSVVGTNSGQTLTDKGLSQVTMRNENGNYKLYAMKEPLMFGLSDASEVATGTINQGVGEGNLVIAGRDVTIGEAGVSIIEREGIYGEESSGMGGAGFDFDSEAEVDGSSPNAWIKYQIYSGHDIITELPVINLGDCDIRRTTPPASITTRQPRQNLATEQCWAIKKEGYGTAIIKYQGYTPARGPIYQYMYYPD